MNTDPNSVAQEEDAERVLMGDLESLETELARQKDLYLRLAADFDNFRKRTAQEVDRRAATQKESFIGDLLPIIDNLERAVSSNASTSAEQIRQGVQMTLDQLKQLLRRHGIEAEEGSGQPFNPHFQEAIATRRDPNQPDHIVLETFQRGYRRGDQVFRPAKVVVNDLGKEEPAARQA